MIRGEVQLTTKSAIIRNATVDIGNWSCNLEYLLDVYVAINRRRDTLRRA